MVYLHVCLHFCPNNSGFLDFALWVGWSVRLSQRIHGLAVERLGFRAPLCRKLLRRFCQHGLLRPHACLYQISECPGDRSTVDHVFVLNPISTKNIRSNQTVAITPHGGAALKRLRMRTFIRLTMTSTSNVLVSNVKASIRKSPFGVHAST